MPSSYSGRTESLFLKIAAGLGSITTLAALGIFAYLGTFTRYLADDYCDSVLVTHGSIIEALINRYLNISDRYSNLLFTALAEFIAPRQIASLPVVMILLWTAALIWLVNGIRRLAGFPGSLLTDTLLGCLLAFFPILEAPNRFQTVYWRSAMATHFAPLVYLIALSALILVLVRGADEHKPAIWLGILLFVAAFFGGGFSEPPAAMLIAASVFVLAAVWLWARGPRRLAALTLVAWTLGGGLLALLVMKFSPAMSFRLGTPPPNLPTLAYRTVLYSAQFIQDFIASLPLPNIMSVVIPAFMAYALSSGQPVLSGKQNRNMALVMIAIPILMYIMIAASFAPSIYGQSYPVERARFAGCFMLTTAGILEGICLGVLTAQIRFLHGRSAAMNLSLVLFAAAALYPLRAGWGALNADLDYYRRWTSAWDARQAQILADKAQGKQDLIVPQLPGIGYVKELDTRPTFWANRCAAEFYEVHSISAPPFDP